MVGNWDLRGSSALVTGSGRRLGRALAVGLAAAGANVAVHYHGSEDGARETAASAEGHGAKTMILQADLSQPSQAQGLLNRAVDGLGEISMLVNNAAIFKPIDADQTTLDDWHQHLAINLTSPVFLIQAFANHRSDRPGAVVNMLDWRALRPGSDHFAYTISKAALAAATHSLAQAYAPNIRVNAVALGAILPPAEADGEKGPGPIKRVPMDRWGSVDEVVQAVLFMLAGPDYITGEILHLDGGRHLT